MNFLALISVMMTFITYSDSQYSETRFQNNNVTITAMPPYVVEGLVSEVDIVCSFKRSNMPSIASVLSMILGHSNQTDQHMFNYLASVNGMEGHAHNLSKYVEVIAGYIDNDGESKLHMRLVYPETHLIGLYMCEVTGFDLIGKPVTIYNTIDVVATNITNLVDALHNAQSKIIELTDALNKSKANLSACQTTKTNFWPPLAYNGHVYYLSHEFSYFNYTEMQSRCGVLGGYLIELDSHDEFSFIRSQIVKIVDWGSVWTGATDEEQEGVWVNKHNSTSRPTFDWGPHQPTSGRPVSCQCFFSTLKLVSFELLLLS